MLLLTQHTKRRLGPTILGALLLLLGSVTMAGWMLRLPAMVEIVNGLVPMVFNTGLGFALTGICLLLAGPRAASIRAALGWFLMALCGLTLAEHVMDASVGIDMAWIHHWYDYGNTRPGRMAPNTALGFMLIGAINVILRQVGSRTAAIAVLVLTFCVLTIGLTGLVGYLLAPDLLFGWSRSARMAIHTASGMITAAIGIWMGWSKSDWFDDTRFFTEATKVRFLGTAILIVATTTVGLTGFVLMQKSLERAIEGRLETTLQSRIALLNHVTREIAQHARTEIRLLDAGTLALPLLNSPTSTSAAAFDTAARRLLSEGYSHIAVEGPERRLAYELGEFAAPAQFAALLDRDGTELVWNGAPMLRIRAPILRDGSVVGHIRLDRPVDTFGHALFDMSKLGDTAELSACIRTGSQLTCLPNGRNAGVFRVALSDAGSARKLPMELALAGGSGKIYALDYRKASVVAAYAPLSGELGVVAKQDTLEAYSIIRAALEFGAPVILFISVLGGFALYSQMDPLVTRMHQSERRAEQSAKKLERLAQFDSLTGLANRALCMDRLQTALNRSERTACSMAILFIDLDGFKRVNDDLGHQAGDSVLIEVAIRMTSAVRDTDTVARLGGDEFIVILEDIKGTVEVALRVAEKILAEIQRPVTFGILSTQVGASIGLVFHEAGTEAPVLDSIVSRADARMYAAKQAGKNRIMVESV